jgi:hypothetical protein
MAPPKSSDIEANNAHSMSATIPAKGPYVSPNVELIWNMASRANVTIANKVTETIAPKASHDHPGWCLRGDRLKSNAIAAISSPSAKGQRTTFHAVDALWLLRDELMSRPSARAAKAATSRMPALIVRTKARARSDPSMSFP